MRVPLLLPIVTTVTLSLAGGFPGAPVAVYAQSSTTVEDGVAWEALLVDPAGVRLLGHGRSDDGTLVLELGGSVRDFVLLLVGPEGTLERFDGYVGDDGTLLVSSEESDTPTMEALETLLGRRGLALVVVHVDVGRDDGSAGSGDEAGGPGDEAGGPGDVPGDDAGDDTDDGDGDEADDEDDGDQDGDDEDDSDPSDDSDDGDDDDDDDGEDATGDEDGNDPDDPDDPDGDEGDDTVGDDDDDDDDDDD